MNFNFGNSIRCTVFGGSHEECVGVNIYGLPESFSPDYEKIYAFMNRRAPSEEVFSTSRKESDIPETTFENGILTATIKNRDVDSSSYEKIKSVPRPGHADYTSYLKYGKIMPGGGFFSGRMTAPLCFAGGVCKQILEEKNIRIYARIKEIYNIRDTESVTEADLVNANKKRIPVVCDSAEDKIKQKLSDVRDEGDSLGAVVECIVFGLPCGLGDAMNEGIESLISKDIFGIPGVKGIEFGGGFSLAKMTGSEANDSFTVVNGKIKTATNNCGGILGGITDGMPLVFRCAFKPTPSIRKAQKSIDLSTNSETDISVSGRHDVCYAIRAVPVVEAVTAITLAGLLVSSEKSTLSDCRLGIDSCDIEIRDLLLKRKKYAEKIAEIKKQISKPIRDTEREKRVISRLTYGINDSDSEYISEIYRSIIGRTVSVEEKK